VGAEALLGESLELVFCDFLLLEEPLLVAIGLTDERGLRGGKPLMVYTNGDRDVFAFPPRRESLEFEVFVLRLVRCTLPNVRDIGGTNETETAPTAASKKRKAQ
jgi:hypothetical protein